MTAWGVPKLALRQDDTEAPHLGTLGCNGSIALYLTRTVVGAAAPCHRNSYGRDTLRLVMAEDKDALLLAEIQGSRDGKRLVQNL